MTKSITISYDEADEFFLLALFKKLKVKTLTAPTSEIDVVRQRLHDKYVINNTWSGMDDEEREDAAHAETMIFTQEQPDYHIYSVAETKAKRSKLRQQLTQQANH